MSARITVADGRIVVPDAAPLRITGDATFGGWIKTDTVTQFQGLISKCNSNIPGPYEWRLQNNGAAFFGRGDGAASGNLQSAYSYTSGSWQFVSVRMSGTSCTHRKGTTDDTAGTISAIAGDSGTDVYLGNRNDLGTDFLGRFAEFFIADTVLSTTILDNLANGRNPKAQIAAGNLKLYKRLYDTLNDAADLGGTATQTNVTLDSADHPTVDAPPGSGVAFDAASSSGYEPALSSYSWSHTCTGTNRGLIVGIKIFTAGTVTAVTYAGQALTFLGAISNGLYRVELWGMPAPTSGTNTIAVTLSASLTSIGNAISYTTANQTTPFIDLKSAIGTGNPASVVVTPATDNDWIVDAIATSDGSITVGAGQTSRANNSGALGSGAMSDKGPITPASAQTMQWTGIGALDTWAYLGVAVDPSVDATVFAPARGIVELRGEIIASWAEGLGDSGGGGLGLMFGPLARRRG